MTHSLLLPVLVAFGLSGLSSCRHHPSAPSLTEAAVTEDTARRAFEIVAAIDYLPFRFRTDGCQYRLLWMAMELAVEKIPSTAQFAKGKEPFSLKPFPDVPEWDYHVAPMLWPEGSREPLIIDPGFSDKPLSRSAWVEKLRPQKGLDLLFAAASQLGLPDNIPDAQGPSKRDGLMTDIDGLYFRAGDISLAARMLCGYLENEELSPHELRLKKARFQERTRHLTRILAEREQLAEYRLTDLPDYQCE